MFLKLKILNLNIALTAANNTLKEVQGYGLEGNAFLKSLAQVRQVL